MVMKRAIFLLLVIAAVWKILSDSGAVTLGPGVYAKESPRQTDLATPASFDHGDYTITPMARFWIKAKGCCCLAHQMVNQGMVTGMKVDTTWQLVSWRLGCVSNEGAEVKAPCRSDHPSGAVFPARVCRSGP